MGRRRIFWFAAITCVIIFIGVQMATRRRKQSASGSVPKEAENNLIESMVREAAISHDVNADFLVAIAQRESSMTDPARVGAAGEIGPLQVTPPAMSDINMFITLQSSLEDKIEAGARFMRLLLDRVADRKRRLGSLSDVLTADDYRLACRAYNAGFQGALNGNGYKYLNDVRATGRCEWV